MFMKSTKRAFSLLMVAAMLAGNIPLAVLAEEAQPVCSGQADCAAQTHDDGCEKAAVDAKTAEDQAAADAVAALIEALPALEDIQAKPMEEQGEDYTQVLTAYSAYEQLTKEQKALLPPAEETFKPYFDYFNSLTQEAAVTSGYCGTNVRWSFNSNTGAMSITGSGEMTASPGSGATTALDWDHNSVKSVAIANGVTSIYEYSFWSNYNLTNVTIGSGVKKIGNGAFGCCDKLTSITLPSGLQEIGYMAFYSSGLTSITFPNNLTTIGQEAFAGTSVTSVNIPAKVTEIGGRAFSGCTELTKFTVHVDNPNYCSDGSGALFNKDKTTLYQVPAKLSGAYSIPNGVKTIWQNAFFCCGELTDVYIPNSVTRIVSGAFRNCRSLKSIEIPESVTEIEYDAFKNCAKLTSIVIPEKVTKMGTGAFENCPSLEWVAFTGKAPYVSGSTVSSNLFYQTTTTVYYPQNEPSWTEDVRKKLGGSTVTWVPYEIVEDGTCGENITWILEADGTLVIFGTGPMYNYASNNNSSTAPWASYLDDRTIQKVIISEGVTTIGDYAFYTTRSSTALTELVLSDSVTSIGMFAFSGCNSLGGNLSLQNVTEIGHSAFRQTQFSTITLGDHLTTIGNYVFADNTALKEINIPANVSKIGIEAFYGCIALEKLALADGLHTIQRGAFRKCSSLKSVTIPATVTDVGIGVFEDCSKLEQATILGSDPNLEQNLFRNCTSLKHVDIPDSVTLIMTSTFAGCTSLEEITIPASVTMMYDATFSGCTNLKVVIFEGDAPVFYTDHFKGTTVTAFYPSAADGWNADTMKQYGGTVTWEAYCKDGIHNYTESVVHADYLKAEATCTAQAEYYKSCVCGAKGTESFYYGEKKLHVHDQEKVHADYLKAEATCTTKAEYYKSCVCGDKGTATFFYGEPAGHAYTAVVTVPKCEEKGFTTHTCVNCSDSYIDTYTDPLNHKMGEWSLVTEPAPGAEGQERSECSRCDHFETRAIQYRGNALILDGKDFAGQTTVWIDGIPYPIQQGNGIRYVELPTTEDCMIVTYTYHVGDEGDVHTQYPTGMKVYKVSGGVMKHIPELDNLLQYSGSSIRITGKKGIRMITSVDKTTKTALTGKGLAGYKLVEYGTALCWASDLSGGKPMVLGKDYVKSNYAYKKGVADPVFAYSGNLVQYTNVLVGFNLNQCKDDIAMRPYIILEDANGKQVTLYGGIIYRSIGYIAYQNRNVFKPGNASYNYVWEIIHHVYGNKYDADYKG